jgi:glycosyltransferase involved in cell wall biosynthesis
VRVAVYDRYWPTGGGGEKFAAGIAAALAGEHRVDLLAHAPVDRAWLGERLGLDLGAVDVRLVPEAAGGVTEASADYDLLVNASYQSGDPSRAGHGLYVVHFPGPLPSVPARARTRLARLGAGALGGATVTWGAGFYMPEQSRAHTLRWTAGDATLVVSAPSGPAGPVPVVVHLGRFVPAAVGPVEVTAEVDGATVGKAVVTAPGSRTDRRSVPLAFTLDVGPDRPVTVHLRCTPWVPADHGIGTDTRRLGIPVLGAHAGGGVGATLARAVPQLVGPGAGLDFLATYDRVVANSAYTQSWTRRMWGRCDGVLYPPVTAVTAVAPQGKEPIILSVGRFFVPGTGHNKKQLEMVQAFRTLVSTGGATGWTYHLVGGCSPEHRPYLDEVLRAAEGLPVEVHADASGAELADLYARASIFWHAAGLGEDPERHPDRYEHFGITTVEAMSAGAVPVVIDAAGQAEVVERNRNGMRFTTLDGLVTTTRWLVGADDRRAEMSAAARERAHDFAWPSFVANVRAEVAALTGAG